MNSKMILASVVALLALLVYVPSAVVADIPVDDDDTIPLPDEVDSALFGAMHFMGIRPPLEGVTTTVTTATGAASADATDMTYHGGRIQHTPAVYVCYWGWTSDPYGEKAYLENFLRGIGGTSWAGVMTQYSGPSGTYVTNPTGILKGTWSDTTSIPSRPTQSNLAAEASKCSSHFGYNPDANYIIASPTGHSMSGFGTQWCAWHSYTGSIAYTYLPYIHDAGASCGQNFVNGGSAGTLDGVSIVGGHEVAETITDPLLNAWYYQSGSGENGDLCAWKSPGTAGGSHNIGLSTGTFAVQTTWSNSVHGCAG